MGIDDLLGGGDAGDSLFDVEDDGPDLFGDTASTSIEEPEALPKQGRKATVPEIPHPTAVAPSAKPQSDGYVVLARKYRPQTFDDIVGQEGVQKALRGAIATGQISHAYLFSGPRGTGKTSTARILAKALNCQEGGPRPDPCGKCASCRSITAGSSLDVIEIDAASNTGVDNIRELKSGVVLAPFSRFKVYIVDEVHMLSNQAFNALLKTLEEPPPQVIFVLATTELHKVPETIISRCSTFMFKRFSLEELKNQLGSILDIETKQRGLTISSDDREKILDLVSRNAEGGMRDAQVTLDQVLVLSKGTVDFESVRRFLGMADTVALDSFVKLINERKSKELLELIDRLVADGQDLELFVKGACEHMRDLLLVQCAGRDTSLINVSEDRAVELEAMTKQLSPGFMINTIDHFLKVIGEMKTSGQPRTILELAVLKLTLTADNVDIQSILKRLDTLEKGTPRDQPSGAVHSQRASQAAQPPGQDKLQAEEVTAPQALQYTEAPIVPAVPPMVAEPGLEVRTPTNSASITDSSTGDLAPVADAGAIVAKLRNRLQRDFGMISLAFEKAVCDHRIEGRTLVLCLNGNFPMPSAQLMRPQTSAQLAALVKEITGEGLGLRMEQSEVAVSKAALPNAASLAPVPPQKIEALPSVAAAPRLLVSDETNFSEELAGEETELKIYYPDEIREKTMVELKPADFQKLLSVDDKLRELVERTKEVFGIDDSRMKFHRSTLA